MKFENVSSQESGRSIVRDFQVVHIHTGLYVRAAGSNQSNNPAEQHYEA
jgi:hypothetical protein